MRLIDAHKLEKNPLFQGDWYAQKAIRMEPTIESVKHGKWVLIKDGFTPKYKCSICGYEPILTPLNYDFYCCKCGAKMDKDMGENSKPQYCEKELDVAIVVRCKDCKYSRENNTPGFCFCYYEYHFGNGKITTVEENHFCGYGVKKE